MSKSALITGITGFSGSHLAEYLIKKGYEVYGFSRGRYTQFSFIKHLTDDIHLLDGDLADINSIGIALEESIPDVIFHLGAQTSVPMSWKAPKLTIDTNTLGTLNLLESVRKSIIDPKILVIGTSEEYGKVLENEVPIKETNPLRPLSPYGVSKVACDLLGYQYNASYGLKTIRVRPFNIVGTRGGEEIITANFSIQIANIESGKQNPIIRVGNLESVRDFNDVRDLCSAYELAIDKCKYGGVYNICTGVGYRMDEMLNMLRELSTRDDIQIFIDKERFRHSDVELLIGDSTKFKNTTGWEPKYTLDDSLEWVLNYWRGIYA